MSWNGQLLIGSDDGGDLEIPQLTSLNDRGFEVSRFNSKSFRPDFRSVDVVNVYSKMLNGIFPN